MVEYPPPPQSLMTQIECGVGNDAVLVSKRGGGHTCLDQATERLDKTRDHVSMKLLYYTGVPKKQNMCCKARGGILSIVRYFM